MTVQRRRGACSDGLQRRGTGSSAARERNAGAGRLPPAEGTATERFVPPLQHGGRWGRSNTTLSSPDGPAVSAIPPPPSLLIGTTAHLHPCLLPSPPYCHPLPPPHIPPALLPSVFVTSASPSHPTRLSPSSPCCHRRRLPFAPLYLHSDSFVGLLSYAMGQITSCFTEALQAEQAEAKRVFDEETRAIEAIIPQLPKGFGEGDFNLETDCEVLFGVIVAVGFAGSMVAIAERLHPRLGKELRRKTRLIANSVGFIQVGSAADGIEGTCILLTPNLLVTCRHVLRSVEDARAARVTLYTMKEGKLKTKYTATTGRLQPDVFFLNSTVEDQRRSVAGEEKLDFALVAFTLDALVIIEPAPGVEPILSTGTWQTNKPAVARVQVAGVQNGKDNKPPSVKVYPADIMLQSGEWKQGEWSYPMRYKAGTVGSYSGGAVLTPSLDLLGVHQGGIEEQHNFGVPIHVVLHCAADMWVRQQAGRQEGVEGVGAAQQDFVRLVKEQHIEFVTSPVRAVSQPTFEAPPPALPIVAVGA